MKTIAIVPIKHVSTRVPGKNYRDFNGKPLYYYIVKTLLNTPSIGQIWIDTDSPTIRDGIAKLFPSRNNILVHQRDPDLMDDPVLKRYIDMNSVIQGVIEDWGDTLKPEQTFLQTHVTNPLMTVDTINRAVNSYLEYLEQNKYDSLFTVQKIQNRFYDHMYQPLNHNPKELARTQDLSPLYQENSCVYLFTKSVFEQNQRRIGDKPYLMVMDDIESTDIDTEADFTLAQQLHKQRLEKNSDPTSIFKLRGSRAKSSDNPIIEYIQARRKLHQANRGSSLADAKTVRNQKQKVVLVTGALGGIGSSICKLFAQNNWYVIGVDIIPLPNNASDIDLFIQKNIGFKGIPDDIIEEIDGKIGRLDCVVNNAAVQVCKGLLDTHISEWRNVMETNLEAGFCLAKAAHPLLVKNSDNYQGKASIVNISSVHANQTSAGIGAYAASKAALMSLTRTMALEWAEYIRVNAVLPGATDTQMLRDGLDRGHLEHSDVDDQLVQLGRKHPMNRVGNANEIAEAVLFLANSEKSSFITGQSLVVDGGATCRLSTE